MLYKKKNHNLRQALVYIIQFINSSSPMIFAGLLPWLLGTGSPKTKKERRIQDRAAGNWVENQGRGHHELSTQ